MSCFLIHFFSQTLECTWFNSTTLFLSCKRETQFFSHPFLSHDYSVIFFSITSFLSLYSSLHLLTILCDPLLGREKSTFLKFLSFLSCQKERDPILFSSLSFLSNHLYHKLLLRELLSSSPSLCSFSTLFTDNCC